MLTKKQLMQLIKEELASVKQEYMMPDTDLDINLEPDEEPELKKTFKYTPNKSAAQAFLQQQFQIPQK